MPKGPSLAGRAVLAIVLMIGFYALALTIAVGLAAIPIAEVVFAGRIHIKVAAMCLIGSVLILVSVMPKPDRFDPPGPELTPERHPRLFAELQRIADATGQAMPVEVYALPEVNAWVAQRGGIMGFFSRRVMGLGIPLMQSLTVGEFKAGLAHEFGHFHGGDTKLGPWIYKTRRAIGDTVVNLHQAGSTVLRLPFEIYGNVFLRITHAISRAQEYAADRLAATTVGAEPLCSGLRKAGGTAGAFGGFLDSELGPAFDGGYRPPMVEGFAAFLSSEAVAQAMDEMIEDQMAAGTTDPFDTHPPLPERIAAVDGVAGPAPLPGDEEPSISLFEPAALAGMELDLIHAMTGDASLIVGLKAATWADLGSRLYVPRWRDQAAKLASADSHGTTLAGLPDFLSSPASLAAQIRGKDASSAPVEAVWTASPSRAERQPQALRSSRTRSSSG